MNKNVIEISDDNWQFRIKGQIVEIAQASVEQEIAHQEKLRKITEGSNDMRELYEANVGYLSNLGGNEKLLRAISRQGFIKLLNTISGEFKKK